MWCLSESTSSGTAPQITPADRQCVFTDPEEKCVACAKKGLACEDKWRRGGSQDTVRISVLEILYQENPTWTLKDALAHLKGICDVIPKRRRESTSPESEMSEYLVTLEDIAQAEKVVKVEAEPLTMELSFPGTAFAEIH